MKIKGMSFTSYEVKCDLYHLVKQDLFEFIFFKILFEEKINRDKKIKDCLNDLEITKDLDYLFNNIYYYLMDNEIIEKTSLDFDDIKIKDLKIKEAFNSYLKNNYLPILEKEVTKEFNYDPLLDKLVVTNKEFKESNLEVVEVNNDLSNVEKLVNDYKKELFDLEDGFCVVKEFMANPYYLELEATHDKEGYKVKNEITKQTIKNNSFEIVNEDLIDGDLLTNNIFFECVYGKELLKDYSKYVFVYDKGKAFTNEKNCIYVDYSLNEDLVDLVNKETYKLGYDLLSGDKVATYYTKKNQDVSAFKLYLLKNKDKFKLDIEKIISLF